MIFVDNLNEKSPTIKQLREEILRLLARLRENDNLLSKCTNLAVIQANPISVSKASYNKAVNESDDVDRSQSYGQILS
jgi:hypothetical protein